ncbi:MAG: purine-binding chemotaxis protein CheW [Clostridiaceae bacterium]|nr:purine-binding chemotaxis protein CheW [Clostridiaceae bacterium]
MDAIQVVVFGLNGETCGVDTSQINSILKYEKIIISPDIPEFVEGVVEVRGTCVPVVNLNKRFGLGETEFCKKTKIIITQIGERLIGFVVNDVFEIYKLSPENIETAPKLIQRVGNAYIRKVGKKEDKLISIIDLEAVLTENELMRLEEYLKDLEEKEEE